MQKVEKRVKGGRKGGEGAEDFAAALNCPPDFWTNKQRKKRVMATD